MADHTIDKPKLFISHAQSDEKFAQAIQHEIEKVFANGVSVFRASSPGAIAIGYDWLNEIERKLETAQAVIVIITPISVERPWIWFELGATWLKGRAGDCKIYPLCAREMTLNSLPAPLNRLQALSMGKTSDLKLLFQALTDQFGFGKISAFKAENIIRRIPQYKDVKIDDVDLYDGSLYTGPYIGYSDAELEEVIDSQFLSPDADNYRKFGFLEERRESYIANGRLLHHRGIDRVLNLPSGTSKKLLNSVAKRYGLVPIYESENLVRYGDQKVRK